MCWWDRVLVLRRGEAVEESACDDFFRQPKADYSRSLLAAVSQQALIRHEVGGTGAPDDGLPKLPAPPAPSVTTIQETRP